MPPGVTYTSWPAGSSANSVEKRFNEPGSITGNSRINMLNNQGTGTMFYTSGNSSVGISAKELLFSGKYGLFRIGQTNGQTNRYVVKRLWTIIRQSTNQSDANLPLVYYNTTDINASLGIGWKWYLKSRTPYNAVSADFMNTWYANSEKAQEVIVSKPLIALNLPIDTNTGVDFIAITNALVATLLAAGHSQKEIDRYLGTNKEVKQPGNKVTAADENKTEPGKFVDYGEPTISIKTSIGYVKINPTSSANDNRPYMIQEYKVGEETKTNKFYFTYIPQTISYTPGGSQWNEIPRSTDAPLAEWSEWSLTKVQMTFLIAGKRTENAGTPSAINVPDGLDIDIENQLLKLRKMATVPYPVSIFNLDTIFNLQLREARIKRVASEWAITDLSIKSKRRTSGSPSKISVAEISLSLTEYPIERQELYNLPRFKIPNIPVPKKPGTGGGNNRPELLTPILTPSVWGSLAT